ncbi:hypothetical protein EPT55_03460 [Fusobacterium necrophorum]|uniref:phage baseplate protein n=1 Tax=Fusobacterium necrophorum TaxID=859 RepID=UPI001012724F|nr:hypothetical protein [Fusobacterium necrophorum]RXZ28650.1 hypothetical protein EPT55_03460 [Fusobacterium necrophorum]
MANWIEDPQNRENVEKVSEEIKLPLYKASAKGEFRPWLKESFNKLEDYLVALKKLAESKEPKVDWKSGGNLEKTNEYKKNDSSFLLDTKGSNQLYEDLLRIINSLDKCPYKVGDIYTTTNNSNPALLWVGTTWEKIEGKFLRATKTGENTGTTGGSDTKVLSVANMPSHTHAISIAAGGNHTHSQDAHAHSRGSMEITGTVGGLIVAGSMTGAFAYWQKKGVQGDSGGMVEWNEGYGGNNADFYASRTWSGSTTAAAAGIHYNGNHNHSASASYSGNGQAFDIKPSYMNVNIWKRLS